MQYRDTNAVKKKKPMRFFASFMRTLASPSSAQSRHREQQHAFPRSIPAGDYSVSLDGGQRYAVGSVKDVKESVFISGKSMSSPFGRDSSARNLGFTLPGIPARRR
jgi:hypothetical protein